MCLDKNYPSLNLHTFSPALSFILSTLISLLDPLLKISSKCKNTALTKAYGTPTKRTCGAPKCRPPKLVDMNTFLYFKAKSSTNSPNFTSKLDSLEDLELLDLLLEWFINIRIKCFSHVVENELVFCESVDFKFLSKAKFFFVKKLEN